MSFSVRPEDKNTQEKTVTVSYRQKENLQQKVLSTDTTAALRHNIVIVHNIYFISLQVISVRATAF